MTYRVDLNRKATAIEILDLGAEKSCVRQMYHLLSQITNDELGCSGNCEGIAGLRNPALQDVLSGLIRLQAIIDAEIERGIK